MVKVQEGVQWRYRERVRFQLNTFPVADIPALPATTRSPGAGCSSNISRERWNRGIHKKIQGINPGLVFLVPGEGFEPTHLLGGGF